MNTPPAVTLFYVFVESIDINRRTIDCLKVCYVPVTSAGLPWLLFLMRPLTVLMKQTRQVGRAIKQSIFLRCLWSTVILATKAMLTLANDKAKIARTATAWSPKANGR